MGWLPILFVLVGARVAANMRFALYSRRWRFASVPDLERIALPYWLDRSLPSLSSMAHLRYSGPLGRKAFRVRSG